MKRKILGGLAAAAMLAGGLAITNPVASATSEQPPPDTGAVCYEQVTQYKYQRSIETETFRTQYEIDKYVRDRTREVTYSASIWQNFSPNDKQGTFEGPPSWPTDSDGTWQHENKPIPPGQAGPDGVYQNGNGNGSWFYRQASVANGYTDWTAWSAPYRWEPTGSHLAWVDTVPAPNWKAHSKNEWTDTYQRQWTEYPTGNTKQVSTGFETSIETTGWVTEAPEGKDWKQIDKRTINGEQVPCGTVTGVAECLYDGIGPDWGVTWTITSQFPFSTVPSGIESGDLVTYQASQETATLEVIVNYGTQNSPKYVTLTETVNRPTCEAPTPEDFVRVTSLCVGPGIDPGIPEAGYVGTGDFILRVRHENGNGNVEYNLQVGGNVIDGPFTIASGETQYVNVPVGTNGIKAVPTDDSWVNTYGGTASTPQKDCTVPTKPDEVTYGDWVGEPECGETEYVQTRTVTTTPYVWVDGEFVLDTDAAVTTTETQTVPVEEVEPCPTTPPTTEPPTTEPPTTEPPTTEPPTTEPPVTIPPVTQPPLVSECWIDSDGNNVFDGEFVLYSNMNEPGVVGTHSISGMPCGPEHVPSTVPPQGLPATGSNATNVMVLLGALFAALGGAAIIAARRKPVL